MSTFHGIPITSYVGTPNGHVRARRVLTWKRFPESCLEDAFEAIGSWPFMHDAGKKDPKSIRNTESLLDYSDEPVLNVRERLGT